MQKYKNKYRSESARLQTWDYARDGAYFITICTHNRQHFFGEIADGKMQLSPIGAIADVLWREIKQHAKNIELGQFVVMPNHVHGILILKNNGEFVHSVGTGHALSLPNAEKPPGQNRFQNQGKNTISAIVGGYKSAVTKNANCLGFEFEWQTRFYDVIIRDEQSFTNISNYIQKNPENWKEDKFYIRHK